MTKDQVETTLSKLYQSKRCILAKISTNEDDIQTVHPIGQGSFGDMLAMMYDRLLVVPMNQLGILTSDGKVYPHDYYPKNRQPSK